MATVVHNKEFGKGTEQQQLYDKETKIYKSDCVINDIYIDL